MTEKLRGTEKILKLCGHVGHLEHLVQHHTLMGALSRVLAEDYRKSADLTYNITRIFLSFSNFVEMHAILSQRRAASSSARVGGGRKGSIRHEREPPQVPRRVRLRGDPGL